MGKLNTGPVVHQTMPGEDQTADPSTDRTDNADTVPRIRRKLVAATLALVVFTSLFVGVAAAINTDAIVFDHYVEAIDGPYAGVDIDETGLDAYWKSWWYADYILDNSPALDDCRTRFGVAFEIEAHVLAGQDTAGITCSFP